MGLKKRLGAFLLCGVIAFHSVCFYTPPAKAAVLESMLANMCLSAYMTATGISLVPDDKTSERLGQALDDLVDQFIPDYQLEIPDFTKESWYTALAADTVILDTGFVRIGSGAAALLGKFTGWLIDKFSLTSGGSPVIVFESDLFLYPDGLPFVTYTAEYYGNMSDYIGPVYTWGDTLQFPAGNTWDTSRFDSNGNRAIYVYDSGGNLLHNPSYGNWKEANAVYFGIYQVPSRQYETYNSFELITWNANGSRWGGATVNFCDSYFGSSGSLSASIPVDYEAAPTVDEQYSMVVNTGLTFEDEQSYIDAVLNGVAAGTLSPTYTIEEMTTGDVTIPGEGEDTEDENAGILNWVKKIWQSVKELPRELMDALTNVFVPSAEYTAALPQMVVDTFDSRSGFLTYPFSVLADFIGRLDDTGDDWIIAWPDIDEPFSGGRLISKGQFNVSQFVRSDLTLSSIYSTWMLITKGYLIFLFLELCHRKYKSVVGDRLE